jgi:alkyldihydroxyacetonephosphate synthase
MSKSLRPNWIEQAPPEATYRANFKWGRPDRFYHPKPGLLGYIQERLQLSPDQWRAPRQAGTAPVRAAPPALEAKHAAHLSAIVGAENALQDPFARTRYAHGQSAEDILRLRAEAPAAASDLVLHPRHKADVAAIVAYCHAERIALTVFGGGSSVTLGVQPARGGVTLVMSTHMHRVLGFNETNQTITVEPGILGPAYEDYLQHAPERCGAR